VLDAVEAIGDQDWGRLKPLLHPYLHWTGPDGQTIRGRANVLRQLDGLGPQGPPARYDCATGRSTAGSSNPDKLPDLTGNGPGHASPHARDPPLWHQGSGTPITPGRAQNW
jgi:hypothetical protein